MNDGVSVIVCCYNSSWIIERCLAALLSQRTRPSFEWEIVVVNNSSTDDTREIAETILCKGRIPYQIVDEPISGLLNARKKGIPCANFHITIYCDDDNLLCETYVQTAYDIMKDRPEVGALGGKGIPEYQAKPDPFVLNYPGSYAVGSQVKHANSWIWGAGLCLRTLVVKEIYDTQTMYLTGRRGNVLMAGDDGELVMSVRLNGYQCDADDRLEYIHVLAAKRLTMEYFTKMHEGFALSIPIMNVYECILKRQSFFMIYIYYIKILIRYILRSFQKQTCQRRFWQRSALNSLKAYHFWSFGHLHNVYNELAKLYI